MMENPLHTHDENVCRIINAIYNEIEHDCETIILYGSTATKESVYTIKDNQISFVSDIEFIVIPYDTKTDLNSFRKDLIRRTEVCLKSVAGLSQCPFVDYHPVLDSFFTDSQLRVCTFELKKNGIVLKGKNYLSILPDIGPDNYDKKSQNIEIVKGMKILLLWSFDWFMRYDSHTLKDEKKYSNFLATSYLNILRTLLPIHGIFESTLKGRIDAISEDLHYQSQKVESILLKDKREIFISFYREKKSNVFSDKPEVMFVEVVQGYFDLWREILQVKTESFIPLIEEREQELFSGSIIKVHMLSLLSTYFLYSLNALCSYILKGKVSLEEIQEVKKSYNKLLDGENASDLYHIIEDYEKLEKTRWRIINSTD